MLHVRAYGPPTTNCPTIVLLHGATTSGWMWQAVADLLDSEYHLLVPDLPEHGESSLQTAGPFSIAAAASQVAALIQERAHSGRAHLVGLSVGAQTALQLLAAAPERVQRVIVTGTSAPLPPGAPARDALARHSLLFKNFGPLIEGNMRAQGVPQRYRHDFYRDALMATPPGLTRIRKASESFTLPANLGVAAAETLVVVTERDTEAVWQFARDILQALPNAQGRVAMGQVHAWPLVRPALFAAVIRAWVGGEALPSALVSLGEGAPTYR